MRTTLDIDADVLAATKEIAKRRRKSAGKLATGVAVVDEEIGE